MALSMIPHIDSYWVGTVPNQNHRQVAHIDRKLHDILSHLRHHGLHGLQSAFELESKLLKKGFPEDYTGDFYRGYSGGYSCAVG